MELTKISMLTKRATGSTINLDQCFGIPLDEGEIHVLCDCDPNGDYLPTSLLMEYLGDYHFNEDLISSESLSRILYDLNENLLSLKGINVCSLSVTILYVTDNHICGASVGGNRILYTYRERYEEDKLTLFHIDLTHGVYANGRVGADESDLKSPCIVSQIDYAREAFDTIILQSGGGAIYFNQDAILREVEKHNALSEDYTQDFCNGIMDTIEDKYKDNIGEDISLLIFHKVADLDVIDIEPLEDIDF